MIEKECLEKKWKDLKPNQIHEITFVESDYNAVSYFGLAYHHLSKIQSGFFNKIKNLVTINLSHNNLKNICKGNLKGLKSLTELYLSSNKIEMIEIGAFKGLLIT